MLGGRVWHCPGSLMHFIQHSPLALDDVWNLPSFRTLMSGNHHLRMCYMKEADGAVHLSRDARGKTSQQLDAPLLTLCTATLRPRSDGSRCC